jgi:hypothetical protein
MHWAGVSNHIVAIEQFTISFSSTESEAAMPWRKLLWSGKCGQASPQVAHNSTFSTSKVLLCNIPP